MKDIHFQQNGVAADYNAVVSRPYRKVPKVAILVTFGIRNLGLVTFGVSVLSEGRYFRGPITLSQSWCQLFSEMNNK